MSHAASLARADVAFVNDKKREIASDFYAIGLALKRLKQPAAFRALGHESFASLCDLELDLSTNQCSPSGGISPSAVKRARGARTRCPRSGSQTIPPARAEGVTFTLEDERIHPRG